MHGKECREEAKFNLKTSFFFFNHKQRKWMANVNESLQQKLDVLERLEKCDLHNSLFKNILRSKIGLKNKFVPRVKKSKAVLVLDNALSRPGDLGREEN